MDMKKFLIVALLILVGVVAFGQAWTVEGDEGFEVEYTLITREQWGRIVKAHETTDEGVMLQFTDVSEQVEKRVIKGNRPKIEGYYYILAKLIPKNDTVKQAMNYITASVIYGNSKTGLMTIMFLSTSLVPNSVSLKYNWDEYARQYNQLIKLISEE
jgi:hypothetical protein